RPDPLAALCQTLQGGGDDALAAGLRGVGKAAARRLPQQRVSRPLSRTPQPSKLPCPTARRLPAWARTQGRQPPGGEIVAPQSYGSSPSSGRSLPIRQVPVPHEPAGAVDPGESSGYARPGSWGPRGSLSEESSPGARARKKAKQGGRFLHSILIRSPHPLAPSPVP